MFEKREKKPVVFEEVVAEFVKQQRLDKVFIRGLVTGIATALGATIVAGLLIGILARTIDSFHDVPILSDIIESIQLEELLRK